MKYKEAQELAAGLRELADFVDAHGVELPTFTLNSTYNFLYDDYNGRTAKEKARICAKTLAKGGRADKNFEGNYLELSRNFGPIKVEFNVAREQVCNKRVVEVIEHPKRVIKAWKEEVVEWDCIDPLLKAS
jgi:hypothetical protein